MIERRLFEGDMDPGAPGLKERDKKHNARGVYAEMLRWANKKKSSQSRKKERKGGRL